MYKVLKSFPGSPDGNTVINYIEGEVVEMVDSLAEVAINEGWIEPVKDSKATPEKPKAETKAPVKRKTTRKKPVKKETK